MVLRRRPEPQKMTLTRALPAPLPVQTKMLANDVGYVRAESLASGKVKEVAAAIAELEKKGAKRFVLDLRQCATGTPEEGVALADLFIEKGLITYLQGQRVTRKDFQADSSKPKFKEPLVILANRGTAGGAEVAAAALQDDKRAELVGERTYGDASQRKAISMDDGGAVILSVAKYYSPAGKAIQDTGTTPANLVAEPDAAAESDDDSDGAKADVNEPEHKPGEDLMLKKALDLLAK
jgi:carboxyl-terminal processing protease